MPTYTITENTPAQSRLGYTAGDQITFIKEDGDWLFYFHGVSLGGHSYEGDNAGPFASLENAKDEAREWLRTTGRPDQAARIP